MPLSLSELNLAYNKLRIISGKWRSRKIDVLNRSDLRPTPDRVREMLFNWLMPYTEGAVCLDLFAGSGALGFEALSRGAAHVDFVEQDKNSCTTLQNNAATLDAKNYSINIKNAVKFINNNLTKYDIIFVDAPFNSNLNARVIDHLNTVDLKPSCKIYVETSERLQLASGQLQIDKQKQTSTVHSALLSLNNTKN